MVRFETPPTNWEEVLAGYPAPMRKVTTALSSVVRRVLVDATESVRGAKMMGYAQYWLDNPSDVLAMISPEDDHVKLYVHHIQSDKTGALKMEGTGKNVRHVKLRDVPLDAVENLLQQVLEARNKS